MPAHLSNKKAVVVSEKMSSFNLESGKEYSVSGWLQFKTGWDDSANRPHPMTPEQQEMCQKLVNQMADLGISVNITMQDKTSDNVAEWQTFGRIKLFSNSSDKIWEKKDVAPTQQAKPESPAANPWD